MIETLEKTGELKTVKLEKDTWILEVPAEVCRREGFAEGTLISLTIKNSGIQTSYIHPSEKAANSSSLKTFTPKLSALVNFEPASLPATTKFVFLLTDEETVKGCQAAQLAGAHFVKTSTGFSSAGGVPSRPRSCG